MHKTVVLFRCHWFDVTNPGGIWTHPQYGLVELNPTKPYPGYDPFVLATQASQVYYASSPGNRRRTVRGRRRWISVFTTRARSVIAGFTSHDHDVQTNTGEADNVQEVYQDTSVPPLGLAVEGEVNNNPINLSMGVNERVNESINFTLCGPTEDDLFVVDDGIEHHSADEYSDNNDT